MPAIIGGWELSLDIRNELVDLDMHGCYFEHWQLRVGISLLSPTCWLWWRDNNEVDGGDDDQRDERTTSPKNVPKNVCWLY